MHIICPQSFKTIVPIPQNQAGSESGGPEVLGKETAVFVVGIFRRGDHGNGVITFPLSCVFQTSQWYFHGGGRVHSTESTWQDYVPHRVRRLLSVWMWVVCTMHVSACECMWACVHAHLCVSTCVLPREELPVRKKMAVLGPVEAKTVLSHRPGCTRELRRHRLKSHRNQWRNTKNILPIKNRKPHTLKRCV